MNRKYQRFISMLLILLLAVPWIAGSVHARATPPEPGGGGIITWQSLNDSTIRLSWTSATDPGFGQNTLSYLVYQSDSDDIDTLQNIENGTPIGDWETNIQAKDIPNFSWAQPSYFNVVVKNGYGEMAVYSMLKIASPLAKLNQEIKNYRSAVRLDPSIVPTNVLTALNDTEIVNTSLLADFSEKEQLAVAEMASDFVPAGGYVTKSQVQFIVDAAYKGVLVSQKHSLTDIGAALLDLYTLLSTAKENFNTDQSDQIQEVALKYTQGTEADRNVIAYMVKFNYAMSIEQSLGQRTYALLQIPMIVPSFNEASATKENMLQTLEQLYGYQMLTEQAPVEIEPFPLDFSKLEDLSPESEQASLLAQWMLDKRPAGGYATVQSIQKAFNAFFNPEQVPDPTPTPTPDPTPDPVTPAPSTGGGSSYTPAPTTKQEQIVINVNGLNGTHLVQIPITRTTQTNGKISDLVTFNEALTKAALDKAKQLGQTTARILIPDAKDAVSETRIELPRTVVKQWANGGINLEISTPNALITIPAQVFTGYDQDLYFRIVPIKQDSERKSVEARAANDKLITSLVPNAHVQVLNRPVEIETNMQEHEVTITLPLSSSLPADATARQQALDNLVIYIEHSDGTKELKQGKLIQLEDGSDGIQFTINKFSTFTPIVVDGLKAAQDAAARHPYIQGFGSDFRPDVFVTRAQLAAMLARNLSDASVPPASGSFNDVASGYWAHDDILLTQTAGLMKGMTDEQFNPEAGLTRAQLAMIAYRWAQQHSDSLVTAGSTAAFTDVDANSWASQAISYAQSAGLMQGYGNSTFKPDSKLTRAEAVKVLNILFKRTPVTDLHSPTFADVPITHWAYGDIEAAASK